MDDILIKLVRTYRFTESLGQSLRLADEIFLLIGPKLRLFVFGRVDHFAADDALQEVLKAVATDLGRFKGDTDNEFWAWCYRIASNKINDHFRAQVADRMEPMPPEEFWDLVEASARITPLTAGDRLDLADAMKLLNASKPECYHLLWKHYVWKWKYAEIAEEHGLKYDNARIKINRCLELAQSLVT